MDKTKTSTNEQITVALDGRSQRWLAFEIRMPETDLSKRMNNKVPWQQEEIDKINARLNSNVTLTEVYA